MVVIDKVCKEEVNLVGGFDIEVLRVLYRRGLIYLDVPVYPDDHFQGSFLITLNDAICYISICQFPIKSTS